MKIDKQKFYTIEQYRLSVGTEFNMAINAMLHLHPSSLNDVRLQQLIENWVYTCERRGIRAQYSRMRTLLNYLDLNKQKYLK